MECDVNNGEGYEGGQEGFVPEGGLSSDTGDTDQDTQALLELGYDQLDGFRIWVDERLEFGSRIAEQDCFNAEFLVDYLANHQHKSVADINEFELRWFLFSHYIRKAMADDETENRLFESLQRFFGYLHKEHQELVAPWVAGTLDDVGFYMNRRLAYASLNDVDEQTWEIGFKNWCDELEDDLDTRCLWLPRDLGNGVEWSEAMGWREATLYAEANALWQRERDNLLRGGLDYESVRIELLDNYYGWIETPQSKLDEMTPMEVIQIEKIEREEDDETDSTEKNLFE